MEKILEVTDLKVSFRKKEGVTHAVNGISYTLHKGETLGIVGESGCGKTVSTMSLLKLISMPPGCIDSGSAIYKGQTDLIALSDKQLRPYRGKELAVIFQDPMTAFNQVMTIGDQIIEGHREHFKSSKKEAMKEAVKFMELTGISAAESRLKDYPSNFSGGMRQRAMIAMALMCQPSVLIADEPTTALDVTIQSQILDLMKELKKTLGTSILWISHDLGVVAGLADSVLVMYAGTVVEKTAVDELYYKPMHPYTQGLLSSLPSTNPDVESERLTSIGGYPPILNKELTCCPFAPRCTHATSICLESVPPLEEKGNGHFVACHHA